MLLIPLLIFGIYLYLKGNRVWSAVIFFFFLSDGFQIIPPGLFDTHLGFNKPVDFCFIYTFVLFIFGALKYEDFLPKRDIVAKAILFFLAVIFLIMGVNYFVLHVPLKEIIQTGRFFFVALSYFLFIRLSREEIDKIHRILFPIVIFQSIIFILQVVISKPILTGYYGGVDIGLPFLRFYNLPLLIYFYVFYALFQNPYSGDKKIFTTAILPITLLLPMHRGMIVSLIVSIVVASYLRGGLKEIAKYVVLGTIIILPAMSIILDRFGKGETENDINNVMAGSFRNYVQDNNNNFDDGTFLFRLAHFYERFIYCQENPWNMAFGIGFMVEGSPYTVKNLDFKIGIMDDYTYDVTQVDTADIAWSNFVIRFGVVGTIAFFLFFGALFYFFLRHKKEKDGIPALMYLLLMLFTSINSSQLSYVWMFSIVFLSVATINDSKNREEDEGEPNSLPPL
jgi:hypothetical protein